MLVRWIQKREQAPPAAGRSRTPYDRSAGTFRVRLRAVFRWCKTAPNGPGCEKRRAELTPRAVAKIFEQRIAPSDGQQEYLFDDAGAALNAVMNLICFDPFRRDNRADIFHKVDAAFLARPAFALLVLASRTFVTQGGMATRAKARNLASVRAALEAFDHALRGHGCAAWRFDSGARNRAPANLGSRVAGLAGLGIPTHAYILAG